MKRLVLEEQFDNFVNKVLKPQKADYLIVGSLALYRLGMDVIPHDIDIEVKCQNEETFKLLAQSQSNDFYENQYLSEAELRMEKVTWKHKPYVFKWQDTTINVWVVTEFSHEDIIILENGVKVAGAMSVIRKKMAYQREKDKAFCVNFASRFLTLAGANPTNVSSVSSTNQK